MPHFFIFGYVEGLQILLDEARMKSGKRVLVTWSQRRLASEAGHS